MKKFRISFTEVHEVEVEAENMDDAYSLAISMADDSTVQKRGLINSEIIEGGCYFCCPERYGIGDGTCSDCKERYAA